AEMQGHPIDMPPVNPANPFFSPDGHWIAFHAQGGIQKILLSGGAVVPICQADPPYGASWSSNDEIFIGQGVKGILRVSSNGGKPETAVSMKPGEMAYGPQLLPGGDWLLFTLAQTGSADGRGSRAVWDKAQIVVQSLKSGERKILIEGADGRYVPTGHLAYTSGSSFLAVRFDVRR